MDLINPFNVFTVAELSEAMTVMPNMYGRVNELGIFIVKGLRTNVGRRDRRKNGSLVAAADQRARRARQVRARRQAQAAHLHDPAAARGIEGIEPTK
jgi:hypothetical protein